MIVSMLRTIPRIALGVVFLVAAFFKGVDPAEFTHQVAGYGIVSGAWAVVLAYALIPIELVLGLALVVGFRPRSAAAVAVLLLLVFMGATAYAWSQGKTEGCGCFGSLTSRTPRDVLLEDLGFLVLGILAFVLVRENSTKGRWRIAALACGLAGGVLLPLSAYALPLDDLVTDLKVGRSVDDLPLRDSPEDLAQGDHLVALLDLDSDRSARIVSRLNGYSAKAKAPRVIAFFGGEVDEKAVFCFNYDPNFEVVAVPRNELKRLYRTLPRFFRIRDGRVVSVWHRDAPDAEELK